jgi:hypothetical protein
MPDSGGLDPQIRALLIKASRSDGELVGNKIASRLRGVGFGALAYTLWSGALAAVLRYLGLSVKGAICAGLLAGIPIVLMIVAIWESRQFRRELATFRRHAEQNQSSLVELFREVLDMHKEGRKRLDEVVSRLPSSPAIVKEPETSLLAALASMKPK